MSLPGDVEVFINRSPCVFGGVSVSFEEAFAVIVGVPFDATSSYRPGSRFAPCEIRVAAANIEFYSIRSRVDVEEVPLHDLGDVAVTIDAGEVVKRVEKISSHILGSGKLLVLLGGEHTVTLGALRALAGKKPCVIVADAHLDLRSEYLGSKLNHATFMRWVVEELGLPVAYVGVRAVSREEIEYAREKNIAFYTSYEVENEGSDVIAAELARFLADSGCETLYMSVDMDVLDPAYAPGVSNPEAEGLTTMQLIDILTRLVGEARLEGFDVVELNPVYDHGGVTAVAAAKIVVELVAAAWKRVEG